jgi:hypothetical protein
VATKEILITVVFGSSAKRYPFYVLFLFLFLLFLSPLNLLFTPSSIYTFVNLKKKKSICYWVRNELVLTILFINLFYFKCSLLQQALITLCFILS